MNSLLKVYELLNDDTYIEVYDLNFEEFQEFLLSAKIKKEGSIQYFERDDGTIIIDDNKNEDGTLMFKTLDDYRKTQEVGFKSTSLYFHYEPSFTNFFNNRFDHIENLKKELNLLEFHVDFQLESLQFIEQRMHFKSYKRRQDVEKLFLGLLAYSGECYIKTANGKWCLDCYNYQDIGSWKPLIEISSNRVIDIFGWFHEGLFIYFENQYMPTITLTLDESLAIPKVQFMNKPKIDIFKTGYWFDRTNE